MEDSKAIIEAIIFSSENPVPIDKIREILPDVEKVEISRLLIELMDEYEKRSGGFLLLEVAGGFQFRTRPDLGHWINKFLKGKPAILSRAAMETLAVVAYKQPALKSEIDRFRGVDSGSSLKGLLDRKLVRIMGRKDVPGRPIMYGTTKKFLEVFNLKDLSELPTMKEMKDLHEEA
ncbi:MAG TPA: SMC-Scp complex subunit ScpB [Syntrophaceae bacterium]|jgi:segregation and condensation protein B|nr:SMC-Scp complex subunit ScpB [Syntrophaceae bacterium]